ncbi:MAG: hypothetical protein QXQ87_07210, partial [Halobacteria archaeon]
RIRDENGSIIGNSSFVDFFVNVSPGTYNKYNNYTFPADAGLSHPSWRFLFNPGCSAADGHGRFEVGYHDWYAALNSSDPAYKAQDSRQNFTTSIRVFGNLSNANQDPNGGPEDDRTQGTNLTAQLVVRNDCGEAMNLATSAVNMTFRHQNASSGIEYACPNKVQVVDGFFQCEFDTINRTEGRYHYVTSSNLSFHYNGTTNASNYGGIENQTNAFYLTTSPVLKQANITTIQDEAWSVPRNFTVNLTETSGDNTSVTLRVSVGGTDQPLGSKHCPPDCVGNVATSLGAQINFTNIVLANYSWFNCASHANREAQFYFVAADNVTSNQIYQAQTHTRSTQGITSLYVNSDDRFQVEKADAAITHVAGNGTAAQPGSPTTLHASVFDLDRNTSALDNNTSDGRNFNATVRFNVTASVVPATDYADLAPDSETNQSGNATRSFDGSGFAPSGERNWRAYIPSADACYKFNKTSNLNVTVIVPNSLPRFRNITILTQLENDTDLAGPSGGWGRVWNFSVAVNDSDDASVRVGLEIDTGAGFVERAVNASVDVSGGQWNYTNFTVPFYPANITGAARYRFNVSNINGINVSPERTFIITEDLVRFALQANGTGQPVNRSQMRYLANGSQENETGVDLTFITRLFDNETGNGTNLYTNAIQGILEATTTGTTFVEVLNATTDSTGNASYVFNPGCSPEYRVESSAHRWRVRINASDPAFQPNSSEENATYTFQVVGSLQATNFGLTSSSITRWDTVEAQVELQDDCSNAINLTALGGRGSFKFEHNTTPAVAFDCANNSAWTSGDNVVRRFGSSGYICRLRPLTAPWGGAGLSRGYYNVTVVTNATNFNNGTLITPAALFIETPPRVKNATAIPLEDGFGRSFNITGQVYDNAGDNVTVRVEVDYGVGFKDFGSKVCRSNTSASDCTGTLNNTSAGGARVSFLVNFTPDNVTTPPKSVKFRFVYNDTESLSTCFGAGTCPTTSVTNPTTDVIGRDYLSDVDALKILRDDLNLTAVSGNASTVNRSGGQSRTLAVQVNDTDRNWTRVAGHTLPGAYDPAPVVRFNITTDGAAFSIASNATGETYNFTNATGAALFDVNPSCSVSVGKQLWRALTVDEPSFPNNNTYNDSTSANYTLYVVGDLKMNQSSNGSADASDRDVDTRPNQTGGAGPPNFEDTYPQGSTLYLLVNVTDDCEAPINNSTSPTLTLTNYSASETLSPAACGPESTGRYNCTWTPSATSPLGNLDLIVSLERNDTVDGVAIYNNITYTRPGAVIITTAGNIAPTATVNSPGNGTNPPAAWGNRSYFNITVTDSDTTQTVLVRLFLNKSETPPANTSTNWKNQTGVTGACLASGGCVVNLSAWVSSADVGTMNWQVSVDDQVGGVSATSGAYAVQKDEVEFTVMASPPATVNRSGSQNASLNVQVLDRTNGSAPVGTGPRPEANCTLYVTTNGSGTGTFETIGFNTTSGGTCYRSYDPASHVFVGAQEWRMGVRMDAPGDAYYVVNNSSDTAITVVGDLRLNITSPQGLNFGNGSTILFRGNLTSDNGTAVADAWANFSFEHAGLNFTAGTCAPTDNASNGTYSCNRTVDIAQMPGGKYNVTLNASRTFYNFNTTTESNDTTGRGFFIQVPPVLSASRIVPGTAVWALGTGGPNFVFNATLNDDDDTVTVKFEANCATSGQSGSTCPAGWQDLSVNSPGVVTACAVSPANPVADPENRNVSCNPKFQYGAVGTWEWRVNATDAYGNATTLYGANFTVTKRGASFVHVQGNGSSVNRTGAQNTSLQVRVVDSLLGGVPGEHLIVLPGDGTVTGSYEVTNDTGATIFGPALTAAVWGGSKFLNTTGTNLPVPFDPGCAYQVGPQRWRALFDGNNYYNASASNVSLGANFSVNVTSYLSNQIALPLGGSDNYTRLKAGVSAGVVPINGTVQDDCGFVDAATVTYNVLFNDNTTPPGSVDAATNVPGGVYLSNYTSAGASPFGLYLIWLNSSKNAPYYSTGNFSLNPAFYLGQRPELTGASVNLVTSAWGRNRSYTVTVNDDEIPAVGDTDTVSFRRSANSTANFSTEQNQTWAGPAASAILGFDFNFTKAQFANNSTWYFNFAAVDLRLFNNTSSTVAVNLVKDNVTVHLMTAPTSINRSDAQPNSAAWLNISITDMNTTPTFPAWDARSRYYTDIESPVPGSTANTSMDGTRSFLFNPGCNYPNGTRNWFAGTFGDFYYDTNNSSVNNASGNPTFDLVGELLITTNYLNNTSYNAVAGRPLFNASDSIGIAFNVSTDCWAQEGNQTGLTFNTLRLVNGAFSSPTCAPDSVSPAGNYSCNFTTNKTWPEGNYSVLVSVDKGVFFNINSTNFSDFFWLENRAPSATNASVAPAQEGWGYNYTYNITVNDPEGDNVTCTLYTRTNGTFVARGSTVVAGGVGNCLISLGNGTFTPLDYANNSSGNANQFRWNVNDGNSSEPFNVTSFGPLFEKDNVSISLEANGTGQSVNRSGSDSIVLKLRINDTDNLNSGVNNENGSVWVYRNNSSALLGYENFSVVSNGYLNVSFNPDCAYEVGFQNWTGGTNASAFFYERKNSSNFTLRIVGGLELESATYNQSGGLNRTFVQGEENVTVNITVRDDCGAPVNASTVTVTVRNGGTTYTQAAAYIANSPGRYNTTFVTNKSAWPAGTWNITAVASLADFNTNNTTWTNPAQNGTFTLITRPFFSGQANVTQSGTNGFGQYWNFSVRITDEDLDDFTVELRLTRSAPTYRQIVRTQSVTDPVNLTVSFNETFFDTGSADELTTWSIEWRATDPKAFFNNTTNSTFTVDKDPVGFVINAGDDSSALRNSNTSTF